MLHLDTSETSCTTGQVSRMSRMSGNAWDILATKALLVTQALQNVTTVFSAYISWHKKLPVSMKFHF